jgi:tetratricopeptide (TPR) repeat protein
MPEQSLVDFMKSIAAADDPEVELARRTVDAARSEHRELPFLIRACAIPQFFDATVVGVLRNAPDDHDGNAELTALLCGQAFVRPRAPGSWVYHHIMRQRLLRDWQSDEDRARFEELNSRLLDHYWQQHEEVVAASRDFAHVGRIIRRASADRYVQIASALEHSLLAPLLEALYHAAVNSADDVYRRFAYAYELHQGAGRLGVCEAALAATREYLEKVQPGATSDDATARLEYWEGRLLFARGRYVDAEHKLRAAVEVAPDEAFGLRVRGQLVMALLALDRMPEAVAACEERKGLAERSRNAWETFQATYQLGMLKRTLEELTSAEALFKEAGSIAQSQGESALEAYARLALCGVLDATGRSDEAFAQAFRAFDISRNELLEEEALAASVAESFMTLFSRNDIRYADTLYGEARALSQARDDSQEALEQRVRFVNVLRRSGQVRRARRVLDVTKQRARDETAELLLEDALTAEASGSPATAIGLYGRIVELDGHGAPPYVVAAAFSNRAQQLALCGEWQRALDDLDTGAARWASIGHERLHALNASWRASILRRSGAVADAAIALEAAELLPLPESVAYLSEFHDARAGVREASAQWEGASDDYRSSCRLRAAAGDVVGAAQAACDAARVSARAARWNEASEWAQIGASFWQAAAEADVYEPDSDARKGDDENGRGVALLFGSARDAVQAREFFWAALERSPDHRWYALNLACACAASGEWKAAAETLERALDGAPEYLRDPDLLYRLADYRLNHAADLERKGELEAALAAYGHAGQTVPEGTHPARVMLVANRLGEAYVRLDRLDLAREEFDQGLGIAVELESGAAASVFERRLAIVAAAEGDAESSATLARASIAREPDAAWPAYWALVQDASVAPEAKRGVLRRVLRDLAIELKNGGEMERFDSQLSIARPPGWGVKESVTLLEPSGQANVIVSTEPVPPGTTTEDYARANEEQMDQGDFPGYRQFSREETEFANGGPAIVRRFEWTPPDGATVTQIQLYHVDGDRGLTATGTTTSASYDDLELDLEQLLLSIAAGSDALA